MHITCVFIFSENYELQWQSLYLQHFVLFCTKFYLYYRMIFVLIYLTYVNINCNTAQNKMNFTVLKCFIHIVARYRIIKERQPLFI